MTTYLSNNKLWVEVKSIPEFLKTDSDREYSSNGLYQYSTVSGIMPLRDGLLLYNCLYVIDMQYRLWMFDSNNPEGLLTSINQVRRIYLVRELLITINTNYRISKIVQANDPFDWYKIRYTNACSIIAIINHFDILLLLTLDRELQVGYIDNSDDLIITSRSIMGRIKSVIGPVVVDNDNNVTIIGLSNYCINRSVVLIPYHRVLTDIDYHQGGMLHIAGCGTLIYQPHLGHLVNLSQLLSVNSPFKSFIRLRQNLSSYSFIRDRYDRIWVLELNMFNVNGSKLSHLFYRDNIMTVDLMNPGDDVDDEKWLMEVSRIRTT